MAINPFGFAGYGGGPKWTPGKAVPSSIPQLTQKTFFKPRTAGGQAIGGGGVTINLGTGVLQPTQPLTQPVTKQDVRDALSEEGKKRVKPPATGAIAAILLGLLFLPALLKKKK